MVATTMAVKDAPSYARNQRCVWAKKQSKDVRRQIRYAWKQQWDADRSLPPTAKAILTAIYRHLGDDLSCFPGQARLAEFAGVSERTVRRHLHNLAEDQWITRTPRMTARGRSTDHYLISTPDDGDGNAAHDECGNTGAVNPESDGVFSGEPSGQNVRGCPDKMAARKKIQEKKGALQSSIYAAHRSMTGVQPPEIRASPASAAFDRNAPRGATRTAAVQVQGQEQPAPGRIPEHLREFAQVWVQVFGDAPKPGLAWLDTYSPEEVMTALARLLVRHCTGKKIHDYRGYCRYLVGVVHAGEIPARRYGTQDLLRIAQGTLPEHVGGVRRQEAPEPPETPEVEGRHDGARDRDAEGERSQKGGRDEERQGERSGGEGQASENSAKKQEDRGNDGSWSRQKIGDQESARNGEKEPRLDGGQQLAKEVTNEDSKLELAAQIINGRDIEQWEVVCRELICAANNGRLHDLDSIEAMHQAWGMSHRQVDRVLREVRAAVG